MRIFVFIIDLVVYGRRHVPRSIIIPVLHTLMVLLSSFLHDFYFFFQLYSLHDVVHGQI